ncbi:hypothetical protein RF11_07669 [Thelohanellus kitauei]|uniref:Uncharacterized protein n=1 Tax=Thelohanellus kitauei TaxID=669202 RepID=A0A0C2IPE6_THEKT|nr:hypothetical protein RF11_07669 [Thelohanellus kitauei]
MGSMLRQILTQPQYAEENPFVAVCYVKLIGSLTYKIQKDVSTCSTLVKSLNDNAPHLSADEISTVKEQISQAKSAIESSVAAYEDSLKKRGVGNLGTVIDRVLKDKAGNDEIFKMVVSFTDNLLSRETSSATTEIKEDPISSFVGKISATHGSRGKNKLR